MLRPLARLFERTSLFVTLAKVADSGAQAAVEGFSMALNRIETQHRLSMTYDQRRKMSQHEKLFERTGVKVYFAEPHSPWQRVINENTNGLLRQYLPKEIDLSVFNQEELDTVAWALNIRPRKSLGFKCPAELFLPDAFNADEYKRRFVALQA
jgi:IS30 family transposase